MNITKEELAARLTGREYGHEITKEECALARDAGLLVLFGYSDDNLELRGAVHDEVGAYGCDSGHKFIVTSAGVLEDWDKHDEKNKRDAREWFRRESLPRAVVNVQWCPPSGWSWEITPNVPHASFEIREAGDPFCRGAVVSLADFKSPAP